MQYQKPVIVQEQRLKMNPQLYQSIRLMALPLQELKFTIQQELEHNPALEVLDDKSDVSLDDTEGQTEEYDYFENTSDPGYSRRLDQAASDSKQKFIEGALARPESLQDHLLWQLRLQPIPKLWFEAGSLLINNLDENGFHREDPATVLGEKRASLLPDLLPLIQSFEPVGACTRDYRESLIVQASLNPGAPPHTVDILTNWFDLLEKGKHAEIARKMKIREEQVKSILEFVKTLEPFPGRQYSTDHPTYVIPDLMVRIKEGEFVIILNDEEIPVLSVSEFFTDILKDREKKEKELKTFVNNSVKDARWFIRSITQRNDTLLKIAKAIVEFQRDFFLRGPKYLVPLTLKDI
ncbi:MAG TPA: RNA polymerase sigma-54 factor, partial [Spirochaetia bacterium]|nr:RNA polymerase sigma-54 factor [Spirochaetia bacterium]